MIDGLIIFFVIFLVVIERKRGFFRSLIDVIAVVMAIKLTQWLLSPSSAILSPASTATTGIVRAIVIFLFFSAVIFIVGNVIYRLTLLTIGDPFEDIFAIIFGLIAACGIVHFFLLVAMSFGSPATQEAIKSSLLGEPLYSFEFYFWLVDKLRPLTDPGKIYL